MFGKFERKSQYSGLISGAQIRGRAGLSARNLRHRAGGIGLCHRVVSASAIGWYRPMWAAHGTQAGSPHLYVCSDHTAKADSTLLL
eukprot:3888322-Rhodomonas_salina.3